MMTKVILQGYIIVPSEDLQAVQEELPMHIQRTQQEEGCLVFEVHQDQENEHRFNVHEEFSTQESFSIHQDHVQNSKWGKVSAKVERHYHVNQVK